VTKKCDVKLFEDQKSKKFFGEIKTNKLEIFMKIKNIFNPKKCKARG